ncbi:MAG: cell wall hydrolase [Proteobacteria bacterium]|nr:cell wall hydrolase [Pseudomonadota bacterium]
MKLAWILWLASAFHNGASDRACLAATVYLEARGEPVTGQMAVAEVGLRRRDGGQWGSSLCTVLRARGQFALSTTSKNYVFDDTDAWNEAWLIAGVALDVWKLPPAWRPSLVPNADHFYAAGSLPLPPGWAKGPPLAVIGDHRFYHAD